MSSERSIGPRIGVGAAVVALLLGAPAAGAETLQPPALPSVIQTVPKAPGMRFEVNGVELAADRAGRVRPSLASATRGSSLRAIATTIAPGVRARFDRWYRGRSIAAVNLYYRVKPSFVDLDGERLDPRSVASLTLLASNGGRDVLVGGGTRWLQGNFVVPESQGRESTALSYAVEKVVVAGSTVVHRGQQRFFPSEDRRPRLRLSLFSARFEVRDALLGFPVGSAIRLEYPNGRVQHEALGPGSQLTVRSLPRGDYRVSVDALGISSSRPVALSSDQQVDLQVITWLDIVIVLLGIASLGLLLLFIRRPALFVRASKRELGVSSSVRERVR
jgi:hypothetical protein